MENNIVEIDSALLANYYAQDFEQIWEKENFDNTGEIQTVPVSLAFSGQPAEARVMFSPGCGLAIDSEIASRVRAAQTPRPDLQLVDQFRHAHLRADQFIAAAGR